MGSFVRAEWSRGSLKIACVHSGALTRLCQKALVRVSTISWTFGIIFRSLFQRANTLSNLINYIDQISKGKIIRRAHIKQKHER